MIGGRLIEVQVEEFIAIMDTTIRIDKRHLAAMQKTPDGAVAHNERHNRCH